MKIRERQTSHMIDFLFPLALFFCFAVSAIVLILMATGIYRSTTESSARNHVGRTALAYVSEKLHQGDADGEVPPENGSVIAEIEAFSMEKISDGLFSFVCREESGETLTQLVSVRSQSAGGTGHE